uniref:RNA-binding protein n=1 Tax=Ascaris suum TaxID=6253 RepID=F1KVS4_ASCSU
MEFRSDGGGFSRPAAMFRTLRRLHGHNLENQGLNNLTDAFQNFVTRAKYFSIGRLRRTWSHSAIEFMKYRRLLPMLTSEGQQGDQFDDLEDSFMAGTSAFLARSDSVRSDASTSSSSIASRAKGEEKKIIVTNVSPRVTTSQLTSFFSKFGRISTCHIPSEERYHTIYATAPKNTRASLVAHITFKKMESAEKAKRATPEELKFYDKIMVVSPYTSSRKRATSAAVVDESKIAPTITAIGGSSMDDDRLSQISSNFSMHPTSTFSLSDVASLFGSRISIENLPSKILQRILSMVPPVDRIRLERVNKTFLEAAVKSWALSDSFSFANDGYTNRTFTRSHPLRNSHLKSFLSRCGIHLRCLDVSGVVHLLDDTAFGIISTYCPHLREVNISGLKGHWMALRNFGDSLPFLRSVTYREMVHVGDKSLWYLFKANGSGLVKVDLRGCRRMKGRCLRLFGPALEQIVLDGCCRVDNMAIEDLCLRAPNVRELRLSGCSLITDETLSLITRSMGDIRTFALCGDRFDFITSDGLMTIARLSALTDLALDYNSAVSNEVLEAIIKEAPELRSLSIAYAGTDTTLTETSLKCIANLKQLCTVDMSSLAAVTNAVLTEIASKCSQLQDIRVRNCTYLGDDGVCSLAQLSRLEHVDLSGCLLVTTKAVQTLLGAFPAESKGSSEKDALHTVTVVVGGTICDIGSLRTRGSRMVVDPSDYSSLSSSTARDLLITQSGILEICIDSDDDVSGDEFESLTAHRSFIIDALHVEEDDSPMDNDQSIQEWAEREARELGLISE